ncbi:MFS transporter permease (plasmid) [Azospirillum sp. TSH58]|uniref:MFS transporter n=1 Tax=Azospirillum sp. TSH58 TaxID=664962 RepID=UPI000D600EB3|nr:MFS transporter [Azospirillum sp. TSH58]AWJ82491.1 MFS transporter permease [Azospirillum sp. TSH58]PWC65745.1 hypothetical protein TSH58_20540 [Azospirillum sp. TSH58]
MNVWLLPLIAMAAVQAFVGLCLFAIPVIAPQAAPDLGVDPGLLGLYTAVVFTAAIPASLGAGGLIARWGAIRTCQACLLAAAGAALLSASALPIAFLLGALALGFAFGPETPASTQLLSRLTPPEKRPLVFSLRQTGNQFGGMAAGFAVPLLVLSVGWQASLLVVAGATAVLALVLEPLARRHDGDDRAAPRPAGRGTLKRALDLVAGEPALRRLAMAVCAFSAMQLCLNGFLVSFAVTGLGWSLPLAGTALAVAQGAGLVGRVGWGLVATRWAPPRVILAGLGVAMSVAAALVAIASPGWPVPAFLAVCAAFGLSASGWNGLFVSEVAHLAPPGRAGEATGGMLAIAYAGLVAGPALFSLLVAGGFGYSAGYLAAAAAALAGVAALIIPLPPAPTPDLSTAAEDTPCA